VDAPSHCDAAACGDRIAVCEETCDDGNTTAGDGCSPDCLIEAGATCGGDPSECEAGACGDGVVAAVEECDDRNVTSGDGCSLRCAVEPDYACEGAPSVCTQGCDADSALDAQTGRCVSRAGMLACSAPPGMPGNLTPLFALSLLGLLLARRRQARLSGGSNRVYAAE
jgi:MYXO-CTERM domain-containing protein